MASFLANENVPGDAVSALRAAGFDVAWIREDSPGLSDPDVLSRSQNEQRVLLTFDKDFGELAFHMGMTASAGIVLFRPDAFAGISGTIRRRGPVAAEELGRTFLRSQ